MQIARNLPWHFLMKLIVSVWPLFSARFTHVTVSPPISAVAFKLAPFSSSNTAQSLCPLLHAISSGVYSDDRYVTWNANVNLSLTSFEAFLYSNWSRPTTRIRGCVSLHLLKRTVRQADQPLQSFFISATCSCAHGTSQIKHRVQFAIRHDLATPFIRCHVT